VRTGFNAKLRSVQGDGHCFEVYRNSVRLIEDIHRHSSVIPIASADSWSGEYNCRTQNTREIAKFEMSFGQRDGFNLFTSSVSSQ
jgi:hypothetical protein